MPDQSGVIRSPAEGTMTQLHAESGMPVAAGTALAQILVSNKLIIQLGVQPVDASRLRVGESILIQAADAPASRPIAAVVRVISSTLDQTSHLLNVVLDPPPGSSLRFGQIVRGTIEMKANGALIVPRSAVLPREDQHLVFTVEGGQARQHLVQIGLQNHDQVQIIDGDLKPGDEVITLGNYQLEDGMKISVENGA